MGDNKFKKGNTISIGNNGGRPTDFKTEFIELAYNYTLLGATDEKLAEYFNVTKTTINNWKHSQPEFLDSIRRGKDLADIEVVNSLLGKAKGYDKGDKHYPPDTTAIIFWLKNRQPKLWRDRTEQEVIASVSNVESPYKDLTKEQMERIDDILHGKD